MTPAKPAARKRPNKPVVATAPGRMPTVFEERFAGFDFRTGMPKTKTLHIGQGQQIARLRGAAAAEALQKALGPIPEPPVTRQAVRRTAHTASKVRPGEAQRREQVAIKTAREEARRKAKKAAA